jgi:hypothetical protein
MASLKPTSYCSHVTSGTTVDKQTWNGMHVDDGSLKFGIINTTAPLMGILQDGYTINSPVKLTQAHLDFMRLHAINAAGTCNLVDPSLENICYHVVFECIYTPPCIHGGPVVEPTIVGLIMTLPHHITLTAPKGIKVPHISNTNSTSTTGNDIQPSNISSSSSIDSKSDVSTTTVTPHMSNKPTSISIKSSLTTHLCVHKQHRANGVGMALIRSVIEFGYNEYETHTGYHYFSQSRTSMVQSS